MSSPLSPSHQALLLLLLFSQGSPAVSASTVTHLPGFPGPLPFSLETGYVTVDEVTGAELFYYFVESEEYPSVDPLLLWLHGGRRCSGFDALALEIGPIHFVISEYNGSLPTLVYNPYSWTKVCNIIFVDSPVGTGFSFSRDSEAYDVGDIATSKQVHKFIVKWFMDHPQFLSNPLYVAGESYSGIHVPLAAQAISEGNEAGRQPFLNLKGYILGNPLIWNKTEIYFQVPYAHGMGIISDELFESIRRNCEGQDSQFPSTIQCATSLNAFDQFLLEINTQHILEPKCVPGSRKPEVNIGGHRSMEEAHIQLHEPPIAPALKCRTYAHFLSYYWANSNSTQEALHIKKGTVKEWIRCNSELPYRREIQSTIEYHLNLATRGYRALIYSGDHDMVAPFLETVACIKSLNFSVVVDAWRSWHVGGQVAGYTTAYSNNLTFATGKGAGHTAPEYRPKECLCLNMIQRWISYAPL